MYRRADETIYSNTNNRHTFIPYCIDTSVCVCVCVFEKEPNTTFVNKQICAAAGCYCCLLQCVPTFVHIFICVCVSRSPQEHTLYADNTRNVNANKSICAEENKKIVDLCTCTS